MYFSSNTVSRKEMKDARAVSPISNLQSSKLGMEFAISLKSKETNTRAKLNLVLRKLMAGDLRILRNFAVRGFGRKRKLFWHDRDPSLSKVDYFGRFWILKNQVPKRSAPMKWRRLRAFKQASGAEIGWRATGIRDQTVFEFSHPELLFSRAFPEILTLSLHRSLS